MRLISIVILWISLICSSVVNASVSRLSPAEGLSQSYVNTLLLDSQGFLWLSTEAGLNRYDGYRVLNVSGPEGVLEEVVLNRIYQDSQERVWIATQNAGFFSYDVKSDSYRNYFPAPKTEEDYVNFSINQILEKDDNHVWLGRFDNVALMQVDTGEIVDQIPLPVLEQRTFVRALLNYGDFLFIATTDGAFVFQHSSKQLQKIKYIDEVTHEYQSNTKRLYLKDSNTLLLGAVKGLYEIDISNLQKKFKQGSYRGSR